MAAQISPVLSSTPHFYSQNRWLTVSIPKRNKNLMVACLVRTENTCGVTDKSVIRDSEKEGDSHIG